jgi:hypothetical protein
MPTASAITIAVPPAGELHRWPAPISARLLLLLAHQQHPALCPPQSAAAASVIITQVTLAGDNS